MIIVIIEYELHEFNKLEQTEYEAGKYFFCFFLFVVIIISFLIFLFYFLFYFLTTYYLTKHIFIAIGRRKEINESVAKNVIILSLKTKFQSE